MRVSTALVLGLLLAASPSPSPAAAGDAGSPPPTPEGRLAVRIFDWAGPDTDGPRLLTDADIPVREGRGLLRISHGRKPNRSRGFELHMGAVDGEGVTLELVNLGEDGVRRAPVRVGKEPTKVRVRPEPDGYALVSPDGAAVEGTYEIEIDPTVQAF